jgi:hypothetical protein
MKMLGHQDICNDLETEFASQFIQDSYSPCLNLSESKRRARRYVLRVK